MNRYFKGMLLGAGAGIIDVIPMIFQKLPVDANISAFSMWVIVGFLLTVTELKMAGYLEGLTVSFAVLTPAAIIIGWKEPFSLIPIFIMTSILGSLLGISVEKFCRK